MNVYVIAPSDSGPSKIGVAANPPRRLRELQTGHPTTLSLYHSEPIGLAARSVERATHQLLRARQSPAENEWFDVSPTDATVAVRSVAKHLGVLFSDDSGKLADAQRAAPLEWLKQKSNFEEGVEYTEEFGISAPDLLKLFASTLNVPANTKTTFNDYILTWDEGMWLRWALERMNKRLPLGKTISPYLKADDFLESKGALYGRKVAARWIEWSMGRDLRMDEADTLMDIWNRYAPSFNRVFESGEHDAHGSSDHVDDVYVFALKADTDRGDRDKVVFWHAKFRAVLIPNMPVELVCYKKSAFGRLKPLGAASVRGFVAPPIPTDIWERSVRAWCGDATRHQEVAFAGFLNNPNRRYPRIERREGVPSASQAWRSLDQIDECGEF